MTKIALRFLLTLSLVLTSLIPSSGQKRVAADAFAVQTLREALTAADRLATPAAKASARFEVAQAYLAMGDGVGAARALKAAFAMLHRVTSAGERTALLARHADAAARAARQFPSERLSLRRLLAQRADALPANAEGRSQIAAAQAAMGDRTGMGRTLARIPGDNDRNLAALQAAQAQADSGDAGGATATVHQYTGAGGGLTAAQNRAAALAQIAAQRAANGDAAAARRILAALPPLSALPKNATTAEILRLIGDAQQSAGQTKAAQRTLTEASRRAIQTPAFNILGRIAHSQAAINDADGMAKTLDAVHSASDAPEIAGIALRRLTADQKKRRDFAGALAAINRCAAILGPEETHAFQAELFTSAGHFGEAREAATAVQNSEKSAALLLDLADAQIETGDNNGVRATLQAAAQATARLADATQRNPNREYIARLQTRSGDIIGATQTAQNLTDPKSAAAAYGDILIEQLRAADYIGAQDVALQIPDAALRDRMLVNIAAWQIKARNRGFVYRYFDEDFPVWNVGGTLKNADIPAAQQTIEHIVDPAARSAALFLIAQTQLALNNREGAIRTANLISDDAARGETLAAVASSRLASGDVAGAEQTAERITVAPAKSAFLIARARERNKNGDVAGARNDYKTAWRIAASQIPPLRLAALQASAGEMGVALDTAQLYFAQTQNREIFLNIWQAYLLRPRLATEPLLSPAALTASDYPKDETLRRVSEWAAWRNDFSTASVVAAHIQDASQRISAYLLLAARNVFDRAALRVKARHIALSLSDPDARFQALLAIGCGREVH